MDTTEYTCLQSLFVCTPNVGRYSLPMFDLCCLIWLVMMLEPYKKDMF